MTDAWPAVQSAPTGPRPTVRTDLSARGTWAMVQRNRDVYLKTWKTNMLPPLLEPLLFVVALGYGLGFFVREVEGVSYAQFIAPAILCITMMQTAFFETTYGSFVRMWFQKTWDAVTATPLSLDDVVVGELVWAGLKSTINTGLMAIVISLLGLLPPLLILPMLPLAFVTGLAFAGLGMMFSAKVPHIDAFQFGIFLLITPMMLFAGTYFPLGQMPPALQWVARALPLTHAVAIARPVALGRLDAVPLASVAYLLVAAVVLPAIAVLWMRRKLVV
ncbi:MAG: lipooligosaccharide transport system permease protein [Thermoplasmata archaeon]|nr:lipooligosaccharide transport system permease protein [Thermoplasmata archaeon]